MVRLARVPARLVSIDGYPQWDRSIVFMMTLIMLSACSVISRGTSENTESSRAPYPRSRYVTGVTWDFSTVASQRKAHGSDLWPCTWARDDNLYCAWGDGGGFDGDDDQIGRVSLGFARVEGIPSSENPNGFRGKNVWGAAPKYAEHPATFGGKVATMISVDGTLYAFGALWTEGNTADPVHRSEAGPVKTLIWSKDLGATWEMAPWESEQWGSFLNFGRDNSGAADSFVYIYYQRRGDRTRVYLKRVPKRSLTENPAVSSAYEYLTGVNRHGNARSWSSLERDAAPVFIDRGEVDLNVVYDAPLGRFLATAGHNPAGIPEKASAGQVGLFEGPHPWGPWTTIGYYDDWGKLGPESHGDYLGLVLPTAWMSADGRTVWAIFSSLGRYDSFNVVKASLKLRRPIVTSAAH